MDKGICPVCKKRFPIGKDFLGSITQIYCSKLCKYKFMYLKEKTKLGKVKLQCISCGNTGVIWKLSFKRHYKNNKKYKCKRCVNKSIKDLYELRTKRHAIHKKVDNNFFGYKKRYEKPQVLTMEEVERLIN